MFRRIIDIILCILSYIFSFMLICVLYFFVKRLVLFLMSFDNDDSPDILLQILGIPFIVLMLYIKFTDEDDI